MPDDPIHKPESWSLLGKEICARLRSPAGQVTFVLYFLGAIVTLGGLGVIIEGLKALHSSENPPDAFLTAMYTYFLAVAGGAAMQLSHDEIKYLRSFGFFCLIVLSGIALVYWTGFYDSTFKSLAFGVTGTVASLALWWIANSNNPSLIDVLPIESLGGRASDTPQGNVAEFKTEG